jgi:hypothetical protein
MTNSDFVKSVRRNNIQSAAMSFIGMMLAVPVSFALISMVRPAEAMSPQNPSDASYAHYTEGYSQGYLASAASVKSDGGCSDPAAETESSAPVATAASSNKYKAPKQHGPMPKHEWTQNVNNSYNEYVTNTKTKTIDNSKTVTFNKDSNNTANTAVVVSGSNGAVVSTNTSTSGDNKNEVKVKNVASNNDVKIEDSFNKDSHDSVVVVNDSFNKKETKNTTIINDSFKNKEETNVTVEAPKYHGSNDDHHSAPAAKLEDATQEL